MSGIDDRRKGMDAKLSHDNELRFKVTNRRNKLVGYWAADKLGKTGQDREQYAKSVVLSDFKEPGDEDVIRKVLTDFDAAGTPIAKQELVKQMESLMPEAMEQITKEA